MYVSDGFIYAPQLVKLCSGMIEAGKAYASANKLFVNGIRDLSQQCKKDEMISVSLEWGFDRAVPVSVVWGLSCVRLCLITNRLVSEDPNGSGNWLLAPARSTSVLLLTLNTIKSLLGFNCTTNCVFPIEVMFVFVVSIVKETKN